MTQAILLPLLALAPNGPSKVMAKQVQAEAPQSKFSIAVMEITAGKGVDRDLAKALGTGLSQELEGFGVFEAISIAEISQLLAAEKMKDALGCDTVTCMVELAGAIGARYSVFGSLLKLDDAFLLQLQLVDTERARSVNRVRREYRGGPAGLFDVARGAVKMLVRDLLALKSGSLDVSISEVGASVILDGVIIGVTPLEPIQVGGGWHTLAIEKEGFVRFTKDVEVQEKRTRSLEVRLSPSEDYKRAYLEDANRWRAVAWSGVIVGGLGVIASAAMTVHSTQQRNKLNADIADYNAELQQQTPTNAKAMESRKSNLDGITAGAWVAGGVGVAALTTGIIAFLVGEDPNHFDAEITVDVGERTGAAVSVRPLIGPNGFSIQGEF